MPNTRHPPRATSRPRVPGIPSTQGISDPQVKTVLEALIDGWHVRNGHVGEGANRFLTEADLNGMGVLRKPRRGGGQHDGNASTGPGHGGYDGEGPLPGDLFDDEGFLIPGAVRDLVNAALSDVTESPLFQSLGTRINQLDLPGGVMDRLTGAENGLIQERQERIDADGAFQTILTQQFSQFEAQVAAVQDQTTTLANKLGATATRTTTLEARLNNVGGGVSMEQQFTVSASQISGLSAQYTVKIDNNGHVSGFGLASTPVNGVPFSEFTVRADRFAIGAPNIPGAPDYVPFAVYTTDRATPSGKVFPKGVYIKTAFIDVAAIEEAHIANASITSAHIRDLTVDTLHVRDGAITRSAGATGSYGALPGSFVYIASVGAPFGSDGGQVPPNASAAIHVTALVAHSLAGDSPVAGVVAFRVRRSDGKIVGGTQTGSAGVMSGTLLDTGLPAGTFTYTVEAYKYAGQGFNASIPSCIIVVQSLKK